MNHSYRVIITILVLVNSILAKSNFDNLFLESDKEFFPEIAEFRLRMDNYVDNKLNNFYEMNCFIKGSRKYLISMKEPAIVRRNSHLRVDDNIWVYLGKINRTKQVSAKASFEESNFSEEDLLSSSLSYYYNLDTTEIVSENNKTMIKFSLQSKTNKTAYFKIESFVDKANNLPVKRYYYSYSGQKIKEMIINEIKKENEQTSYIKLVMRDLLRKGYYTTVEMKNFKISTTLDDKIFTKKYMEMVSE